MFTSALICFGKNKQTNKLQFGCHSHWFLSEDTSLCNFKELSTTFAMYQETPETFALIKDLLSHTLLLFHWL